MVFIKAISMFKKESLVIKIINLFLQNIIIDLTQHLVLSTARASYENDGVEGYGWSARR